MAAEPEMLKIESEMIEGYLGEKIKSHEVSIGSALGDGYASVIYSIKAIKVNDEVVHLFLKIFPDHPMRQQGLIKMNIFYKEVCMFEQLIPEMQKLIDENNEKDKSNKPLKLAFPPYLGGKSQNYPKDHVGQVDPFENFLLMIDLRKTYDFKMADRFKGLDYEHCTLVMKELAKIHAVSWAYKTKRNIKLLTDKFEFIRSSGFTEEVMKDFETFFNINLEKSIEMMKETFGDDSPIAEGALKIKNDFVKIFLLSLSPALDEEKLEAYYRVPYKSTGDDFVESTWKVLLHGDCWVNNILFKYKDEKPIDTVLVDLQISKEGCPTIDMAYFIYTGTTQEVRKNHLDDILKTYHDSFIEYCKVFEVEPLEKFNMDTLKRKFHRGKLYGLIMACFALPLMIQDTKDIIDVEKVDHNLKLEEIIEQMKELNVSNDTMKKRISDIGKDLYDDGII